MTAVMDRIHAGGPSVVSGSFNLLLRRTTKFADICEYPEPLRNAWVRDCSSKAGSSPLKVTHVILTIRIYL